MQNDNDSDQDLNDLSSEQDVEDIIGTEEVDDEEDEFQKLIESKMFSREEGSLNPTQLYLNEIGFSPLLTADEEKHYGRLVLQGDEAARKRMIESNLRLVVKIARRYLNRNMAFLDLIEEGNLGLMHAVEKFDPDRGFRFSTYATWWIKQSIERSIMNQTRTIRLPIHVIKELNIYLRAAAKLSKELDRKPTPEQIAEMIDKPLEDVKSILGLADDAISIDLPTAYDSTKTLLDTIADENQKDPTDLLFQRSINKKVIKWMEQLSDKNREVLERRFALGQYKEKSTFEKVAKAMGLSRERVRQLQLEALRDLRNILEKNGISSDLLFKK